MAATNFHERHQELAAAVDIPEEQKEANMSLINVSESPHDETFAFAFGENLLLRRSYAIADLEYSVTANHVHHLLFPLCLSFLAVTRCTESSRRSASWRGTTRGPSSTGPKAWRRRGRLGTSLL